MNYPRSSLVSREREKEYGNIDGIVHQSESELFFFSDSVRARLIRESLDCFILHFHVMCYIWHYRQYTTCMK